MNRLCSSLLARSALSAAIREFSTPAVLASSSLASRHHRFPVTVKPCQPLQSTLFSSSSLSTGLYYSIASQTPTTFSRRHYSASFTVEKTLEDLEKEGEENESEAGPVSSTGEKISYEAEDVDKKGWSKYDLDEKLIAQLKKNGFEHPFEVQDATLKHSLAGKDLCVKACTGSGKTLAFAIPIINSIYKSGNRSSQLPKCLVLSPTRELCLQLQTAIQELAPDLSCLAIYGGEFMQKQASALRRKVDIVIATPGRLKAFYQSGEFQTTDIQMVCLDEADELLTPNFVVQINDIISSINKKKQTLLFSATLNGREITDMIRKYMQSPIIVNLANQQKHKLPPNIIHYIVKAPRSTHVSLIRHYINEYQAERCIVFVNMKRDAKALYDQLRRFGVKCQELHGDIQQNTRSRIFQAFRDGQIKVLVATDAASRGLDIPEINLVIHMDTPKDESAYVHRSGRTGRAGRPGSSIIISQEEFPDIRGIKKMVQLKPLSIPANMDLSMSKNSVINDDEFGENKYLDNGFGGGGGFGGNRGGSYGGNQGSRYGGGYGNQGGYGGSQRGGYGGGYGGGNQRGFGDNQQRMSGYGGNQGGQAPSSYGRQGGFGGNNTQRPSSYGGNRRSSFDEDMDDAPPARNNSSRKSSFDDIF